MEKLKPELNLDVLQRNIKCFDRKHQITSILLKAETAQDQKKKKKFKPFQKPWTEKSMIFK
jgi:hypothetical protein